MSERKVSERKKCRGTTKNGDPCSRFPLKDTKYCKTHSEMEEEEEEEVEEEVVEEEVVKKLSKLSLKSPKGKKAPKKEVVEEVTQRVSKLPLPLDLLSEALDLHFEKLEEIKLDKALFTPEDFKSIYPDKPVLKKAQDWINESTWALLKRKTIVFKSVNFPYPLPGIFVGELDSLGNQWGVMMAKGEKKSKIGLTRMKVMASTLKNQKYESFVFSDGALKCLTGALQFLLDDLLRRAADVSETKVISLNDVLAAIDEDAELSEVFGRPVALERSLERFQAFSDLLTSEESDDPVRDANRMAKVIDVLRTVFDGLDKMGMIEGDHLHLKGK